MLNLAEPLRLGRADISDVGESILDVGEQTVGETTVIQTMDGCKDTRHDLNVLSVVIWSNEGQREKTRKKLNN